MRTYNISDQVPIRTVCSLTGVNAVTLRAWERRYGLILPLRTAKGHRLYTSQHVEQIRRVLTLVDRGIPISRVRELLDREAKATLAAPANDLWRGYIEQMASAIARFDECELDRIYDEALSVHSIEHVTDRLLVPLLTYLGERWGSLAGAISEEHFFAVYLRSKLGARLQHRMRYATGPRLLAACAPGEQHEIGLLLFALEANQAGLRTVLLGANTPLEELVLAQQRARADAIVVAASLDPSPELLERALPKLVREARVPVFVGGSMAVRHRATVTAAGATALGIEIENGVRLIQATLTKNGDRA